ncbi:helix-turn-helix domain-containing protein [Ralstonia wenshanensis]|uniref:helix-turn-helix domain-containing protein n=1 Tax=Ralstonia wenshanensis TaxID=2842456 RepID=UPI003D99A4E9
MRSGARNLPPSTVTKLGQKPLTQEKSLRYLQSLRIEAARGLLEAGDLSLERIAVQVGYNDTSSFCRLFKDKVGLSPGAYRGRFRPTAEL